MRGGFGTIFRRKSVPYAFFRPRGKAAQEKRAVRKNESFIFAVRVDFVDTQRDERAALVPFESSMIAVYLASSTPITVRKQSLTA